MGMVGACVPGVERGTTRVDNQPVDVRMDGGDVTERRTPARDDRLIGRADQRKARSTEAAQSVRNVGLEPYLVRRAKQVDLLDQHSVSIEEDRRS